MVQKRQREKSRTDSKKKILYSLETRGGRVCGFIERYCIVPEGKLVGKPIRLIPEQVRFILAVYDNPHGTSRAILSIARKNGKTAIIAAIALAHLCGPEAQLNSQIVSGAMSKDQAGIVFKAMAKMIRLSPELMPRCRIIDSKKEIYGLSKNVEYKALAADGHTAHGLSPILAILDEVGQVRGPKSEFIDAIITSQGAHEGWALQIVISTQAANDADLLSVWIDDAVKSKDKRIVCHVHAAPEGCSLLDEKAWAMANPGLSIFRSLSDVKKQAEEAMRMPSAEATFRNLILNQRVEVHNPFVSKNIWLLNSFTPSAEAFRSSTVFAGLDLSQKLDLTAFVMVAFYDQRWHVKPIFWTPEKGLADRANRDRTPYDVWVKQGFLRTTPGAVVDYKLVVKEIAEEIEGLNVAAIAYDRWRIEEFTKDLHALDLEWPLVKFGQGYQSMAPALDSLEEKLVSEKFAHGMHPVLTMCAANSVVAADEVGNRKLTKAKSTGRIDGMVALAMAIGAAGTNEINTDGEQGFIDLNELA